MLASHRFDGELTKADVRYQSDNAEWPHSVYLASEKRRDKETRNISFDMDLEAGKAKYHEYMTRVPKDEV